MEEHTLTKLNLGFTFSLKKKTEDFCVAFVVVVECKLATIGLSLPQSTPKKKQPGY